MPYYRRGSLEERFWWNVDKNGPKPSLESIQKYPEIENTICWIWTGHTIKHGYGRMKDKSIGTHLAHRIAFYLANGRWPNTTTPFILHKCDNPPCVRLEHFIEGTHPQNIKDSYDKNRGD